MLRRLDCTLVRRGHQLTRHLSKRSQANPCIGRLRLPAERAFQRRHPIVHHLAHHVGISRGQSTAHGTAVARDGLLFSDENRRLGETNRATARSEAARNRTAHMRRGMIAKVRHGRARGTSHSPGCGSSDLFPFDAILVSALQVACSVPVPAPCILYCVRPPRAPCTRQSTCTNPQPPPARVPTSNFQPNYARADWTGAQLKTAVLPSTKRHT